MSFKSFQDWDEVKFVKKEKPKKNLTQNAPGTKQFKKLEGDEMPPKLEKYTQEQVNDLMELRKIKNYTQQDLARYLNIDVSIIKAIENKTATYNKSLYTKLINTLMKVKTKETTI